MSIDLVQEKKETTFVLLLVGVAALMLSVVVIGGQGSLALGWAFLAVLLIVALTIYRLDLGFYLVVGMVLFSDRYDVGTFYPFTYAIMYLSTINTLNPSLAVGVLTAHEVHLLFLIVVWIVSLIITRRRVIVPIPVKGFSVCALAWIVWSVAYGTLQGGNTQMALWEIRALPLVFIMFWLTPQIIQSKRQLQTLLWVIITTVLFKALQGIERFIRLDFTFGPFRGLTNSEDPLFFIALFILLIGLVIFKEHTVHRRILFWSMLPLLLGFYLGNRRATYASFAISLIAVIVLLPTGYKRVFSKYMAVFGVLFLLYLAAFWNSYGRMGMVAHAVKSTIFPYDKEMMDSADYSSGLAREQENYNLAVTFRHAALFGIGFGRQHDWAIHNYGSFALKGYVTHNQILWFLVKSGCVGYFLLFLFLNITAMYGGSVFINLKDPFLRAVCLMAVVAIINQVVTAHVEQQLINSRPMTFLGLMLGLLPAVKFMDEHPVSENEVYE